MNFKFELGVRVQDTITDFDGAVTGRFNYSGGNRYQVTSYRLNDKGGIVDEVFDEQRLRAHTPEV